MSNPVSSADGPACDAVSSMAPETANPASSSLSANASLSREISPYTPPCMVVSPKPPMAGSAVRSASGSISRIFASNWSACSESPSSE